MDIILRDWPFLALVVGVPLFGYTALTSFTSRSPPKLVYLHAMGLAMYMIHQFEEHGYDIFSRSYHFQVFMCKSIGFGGERLGFCPVSEQFILVVNVVAVWVSGLSAILFGDTFPVVGLSYYGIPFVNAFGHIVSGIRDEDYNPGLLTSILHFLPISVYGTIATWFDVTQQS